MFFAVTCPLPGLYVAFHPELIACPPGRVKASDQPLIADVPVFVMLMLSVSPVFQAFTTAVTRHAAPPTGGLDTGGLDTGGLDTGGLDTGGLETGGLETGGLDTGGLDT